MKDSLRGVLVRSSCCVALLKSIGRCLKPRSFHILKFESPCAATSSDNESVTHRRILCESDDAKRFELGISRFRMSLAALGREAKLARSTTAGSMRHRFRRAVPLPAAETERFWNSKTGLNE